MSYNSDESVIKDDGNGNTVTSGNMLNAVRPVEKTNEAATEEVPAKANEPADTTAASDASAQPADTTTANATEGTEPAPATAPAASETAETSPTEPLPVKENTEKK